ncbi:MULTISPECIES: DUF1659 domain-containing protein [Bacillaceae]|uniref:DUF1659 domain-containing protein n=1 Tax=Bacillaceae TaxID=186817 RepID=UPI000C78AA21|nr:MULTISPECIES: DUF1659 domain-containing protein [Bacillaceae]PLR69447.1 hypothetical protein CYJ36_03110 [Bacillus sp. UMB0893]QNG59083.1 DUF1659 domain-containing protein [Bacillus sp. PAMC26568]
MAETIILDSQLRLVFEVGVDEKGEPVFKSKNYNNIKTSATAEQLLEAATAITGLQTQLLAHVERNDSHQVTA